MVERRRGQRTKYKARTTGRSIRYTTVSALEWHIEEESAWLNKPPVRSLLREEHALPQDLRVKLQLLDFANLFFQCYTQRLSRSTSTRGDNKDLSNVPTTASDRLQQQSSFVPTPGLEVPNTNAQSSWIIPHFMRLCTMAKEKVSVTRWVDVVARFTMQAAADQFHQYGGGSSELLDKCLSWEPEDQYQTAILKESKGKCRLQMQTCASLETYLDKIPNTRSLSQLEGIVCEFLSDLMEVLDPPVLLQLERGQLGKLNRTETEQLKSRIGFR